MTSSKQKALNKGLVAAAYKGNVMRMERMLTLGAELEAPVPVLFRTPRTALQAAAASGWPQAVEFLLERGADMEKPDAKGDTPAILAVKTGYNGALDVLLRRGASLEAVNASGQTPLQVAIHGEHVKGLKCIREHLARREQHQKRLQQRVEAPVVSAPAPSPEPAPESQKTESPDIVVFTQKAGERTIEEVFNFVSLERTTFVSRGPGTAIESMLRVDFAAIENRALLRKALEEHARRGGGVTEGGIFADTKPKRPALPGGQP